MKKDLRGKYQHVVINTDRSVDLACIKCNINYGYFTEKPFCGKPTRGWMMKKNFKRIGKNKKKSISYHQLSK